MLSVVPLEALDVHDGTIGAVGAPSRNDFACQNGGPELLDKCIIGRNLFDFVSGADVQSHIRRILYEL
jgi:hypothetical protein